MFELILSLFYLENLEVDSVGGRWGGVSSLFYLGSSQLLPVSISVPDPPVGSFVVIDFGPATLDPTLLVGEVPPNHSPDRNLHQGMCPVSCEAFAA